MSPSPVRYQAEADVATVTLDDGKRNVLGPPMLAAIEAALDRAEAEAVRAVILTGRDDVFSAGFDLAVLGGGGTDALRMLDGGFALAERLLGFPAPVVAAVNGHAIAVGLFLVLSVDLRIGAATEAKFVANEVAIGLTLPRAAAEICRQRLSPAHLSRVTLLSEPYAPSTAVAAGILDRVVEPSTLQAETRAAAEALTRLDAKAHTATKRRLRGRTLRAIRTARRRDMADFAALGIKHQLAPRSR